MNIISPRKNLKINNEINKDNQSNLLDFNQDQFNVNGNLKKENDNDHILNSTPDNVDHNEDLEDEKKIQNLKQNLRTNLSEIDESKDREITESDV